MTNLERLQAFEAEKEALNTMIEVLALELYESREGRPMDDRYSFDGYEIYNDHIIVTFEWYSQGGPYHEVVRFPLSYLDTDWHPAEQAILDGKAAGKAIANFAKELRLSIERDARDRRDYERLRAKFEMPSNSVNSEGE